jgi:excisionase family DNA binding protein
VDQLTIDDELLTVAEVAERRKCSVDTVRRAIRAGRLRASRPNPHGPYLVYESRFREWIEGGTVEHTEPRVHALPAPTPPPRRGSLRALAQAEGGGDV